MSTPDHRTARVAGLVYLVVVVTGIFSLAYATERIFVGGPDAIAASILANEQFYRAAIVVELLCYTSFLVLPLILFRLLSPVGTGAAVLMAALAMASVPVGFANTAHHFDLLHLAGSATPLDPHTAAREQVEMVRIHRALSDGYLMLKVFWGGWLIPFGYLVFRSGFLPKVLGIVLVLAGIGYLADFLALMLWAGYADTGIAGYLRKPRVGEILIALWLTAFGARRWPFSGRLKRGRSP